MARMPRLPTCRCGSIWNIAGHQVNLLAKFSRTAGSERGIGLCSATSGPSTTKNSIGIGLLQRNPTRVSAELANPAAGAVEVSEIALRRTAGLGTHARFRTRFL